MEIGIIDADLLDNKARFPNLALMKISSYWKNKGHHTELIEWDKCYNYDKIFVSKVFDYTKTPQEYLNMSNVYYGGTGFFFDKAKPLPNKVEHIKPDYKLYSAIDKKLKYYHDTSIGFTTRGCFRQCKFCVNRNYTKVEAWSPIEEFYDQSHKRIVLLDDNILGYDKRIDILNTLIDINKPFEFKQGMDIRLMSPDVAKRLSSSKYSGDFIFAFDDWDERIPIVKGLTIWNKFKNNKNTKLYLLVGYKNNNVKDVVEAFKRIRILMYFRCIPYIMRYSGWDNGEMRGMYINLARWCNQPIFFKKLSFREFIEKHPKKSSTQKYANEFESKYPDIADEFFDLKFGEVDELYL